ncbi:gamma-glutamyltransferase [Actinoplanes sp. SE50]|uniref:gamma-glutamyltransferase n=1 Tax=unclassified Actinoplanes TaxID=2626549 RepID=UPI00023EC194|nr:MULTISPECIES: gamma-glutamyltransferase [unclassified Actinoplanes]AEV87523.1 gamma-glutamyltranspeptidase [Actinoplanes sp. SE50/110]ATO85926.1 gamma-glutamyltransferase [Actinoplanes sp. SE50]SLM03340.1 gamma-glutamyltranspeptidase [Actinoplanes sp. SE50/110]
MRFLSALAALSLTSLSLTAVSAPALAATGSTAQGYGGAIATVDATATAAGLEVLRRGGNAVDAAVAAAATLGVTEPFASGIGGGGFFVYYDAHRHRVFTIDGREKGPASMTPTYFVNPVTGQPYAFDEARVSGLSVGVPGTLATWEAAARQWGTRPLSRALDDAAEVADRGYTVDGEFRRQVTENAAAFGQFDATRALYLPGGAPPAIGTVIRNPDLADTYRLIARKGTAVFYRGPVGADILQTVTRPPVSSSPSSPWAYPIRPGVLTAEDLASYQVRRPAPTRSDYQGLSVYGMSTPSSGGTAVGEALNILDASPLDSASTVEKLHYYLEASALAFADRGRYVGADTPRPVLDTLLSDRWARQRACQIDPHHALVKPVAAGPSGCTAAAGADTPDTGMSTTNLTVADRWGNVVEYTLTLEQFGGNGMVVPGRGFMLNNELTDFNFTGTQGDNPDPNLPGPGKRPRSSMSPTIVLKDGRPYLAAGAPGGSTIITTVLQILYGRLELGLTLPQAVAAPRAAQRNTAGIQAEPAFHTTYGPELTALGHVFGPDAAEIGAATAIEFGPCGSQLAVAEPVRRGGGSAGVVHPR